MSPPPVSPRTPPTRELPYSLLPAVSEHTISAQWGVTENGRRARYYQPTAAGRAHLRDESDRLTDYVDALTAILSARTAT